MSEQPRNQSDSDKRELFERKWQAQLDGWKAELERLRARAAQADADARIRIQEEAENLERQIEEGRVRLAELAEASGDAWDAVMEGVESAWEELGSAVKNAASKWDR